MGDISEVATCPLHLRWSWHFGPSDTKTTQCPGWAKSHFANKCYSKTKWQTSYKGHIHPESTAKPTNEVTVAYNNKYVYLSHIAKCPSTVGSALCHIIFCLESRMAEHSSFWLRIIILPNEKKESKQQGAKAYSSFLEVMNSYLFHVISKFRCPELDAKQ